MGNNKTKGTIKGKISTSTKKAIRPKLGKGTGGIFTAKIVAHVQKEKKKDDKKQ